MCILMRFKQILNFRANVEKKTVPSSFRKFLNDFRLCMLYIFCFASDPNDVLSLDKMRNVNAVYIFLDGERQNLESIFF